jgi:hypothetical protein
MPADAAQPSDGGAPADSGMVEPKDGGAAPDSGMVAPDAGDLCVEGPEKRGRSNVFYGTDLPTYVPLTSGQIQAVGNFFGCSGMLIAPAWVLTAEHCGIGSGASFCIGTAPDNANACIGVLRAIDHPNADLTLVELEEPAADHLPSVQHVPLLTESLDQSWIGLTAEAAGYGTDENGGSDRREFTA